MKTIKRERQVRLDGLLKYVWDNNITRARFESKDCSIYVDDNGNFNVADEHTLWKNDFYTIEGEVLITEETKLNIVTVSNDHETYAYENTSIYDLLSEENPLFEEYQAKFIYLQNSDGSIGDLIWSKERGLVD